MCVHEHSGHLGDGPRRPGPSGRGPGRPTTQVAQAGTKRGSASRQGKEPTVAPKLTIGSEWANRRPQGNKSWDPRRQWKDQTQDDSLSKQLAELKARVSMLTTLALRQEIQLNICRQDTAYVVFIQTSGQDSIARTLYSIGTHGIAPKPKILPN